MTVYVDSEFIEFRNMKMSHMIADTEDELQEFALKLKLKLSWWQAKGTAKSHFDVSISKRKEAISLGAVVIEREDLVRIINCKKESIKNEKEI